MYTYKEGHFVHHLLLLPQNMNSSCVTFIVHQLRVLCKQVGWFFSFHAAHEHDCSCISFLPLRRIYLCNTVPCPSTCTLTVWYSRWSAAQTTEKKKQPLVVTVVIDVFFIIISMIPTAAVFAVSPIATATHTHVWISWKWIVPLIVSIHLACLWASSSCTFSNILCFHSLRFWTQIKIRNSKGLVCEVRSFQSQ